MKATEKNMKTNNHEKTTVNKMKATEKNMKTNKHKNNIKHETTVNSLRKNKTI